MRSPPQGISSCGELVFNFANAGLRAGMEWFHLVLALWPALHFVFFYILRVIFFCVPIVPNV